MEDENKNKMPNVSVKKEDVNNGIYSYARVRRTYDVTKKLNDDEQQALSDMIKNCSSEIVFNKWLKEFKRLANDILEAEKSEALRIKTHKAEFLNNTNHLLEEIRLMELAVNDVKADKFFIATQAMRCTNLYNQCFGRVYFEKAVEDTEKTSQNRKVGQSAYIQETKNISRAKYDAWQKEATDIWSKNVAMSKSDTARIIKKRLLCEDSHHTIRQNITKPDRGT